MHRHEKIHVKMYVCISELYLLRKAEGKRIQTFSSYCVQDSSTNQALEKHTAEFSEPTSVLQVQSFTSLSYIASTTMAES